MFNRIRGAVSRTSERYFPRGRHRRSLAPLCPRAVPLDLADAPTLHMGQLRHGMDVLADEDSQLVRPYVLARREGAKQQPTPVAHKPLAQARLASRWTN
ncbi:hypothetical protein P8A22_25855 [Streptomyces laculatispora]|uniref:Uncharacterized protein n=1 Tax=Streptomyces laculatispora TaxID=887464 RepID=A0ABY9I862_9ACTN|nr:hypothetical protein [Streptomyces laculatispora]WLQ43052.1 hypothetical protein P8A22_25855 [Streptomyces laculatispora]